MKASKVLRQSKAHTVALPVMLTIGHSTHPLEEYYRPASGTRCHARGERAHGAVLVAQSAVQQNVAARIIEKAGLEYVHMPGLGGLRHAQRDSINTGWQTTHADPRCHDA